MKFKEWYKQEYKESFSMQSRSIKIHAETAWDFSRESTIEEFAEIARNHPVFFKNGNMKSADIVRREIAEAIEKSREA